MSYEIFSDRVFLLLGKAMDAYSLRHRVAADNIANANTPGFKRSYVPFESQLRELLDEGDEEGIAGLEPQVRVDDMTQAREDGNNVDMEQEMAEMVKNSLRYSAAGSILRTRVSMYRYVISEGKR
ncbi:MAG: flagellar basal body rod protein FlgB [Actinobacteria bacterium]|nr:flagellar basal body rod protein FlgB [Actinomycetota bacterium]